MSLGLPEFGSRSSAAEGAAFWRGVQVAGVAVLVYAIAVAGVEGMNGYTSDRALSKTASEVAVLAQSAESARRTMLKSPDLLVAALSVESSPERVMADLKEVLPEGVSVTSYRMDYQQEATARVEVGVIARGPEAYDRFLTALSKSKRFSDIRPGSESRPGMVRATVTLVHRPQGSAR